MVSANRPPAPPPAPPAADRLPPGGGTTLGAAAAAAAADASPVAVLRLQAQLCRARGAAVLDGGRVAAGDVAGWSELAHAAAGRAGVEAGEAAGTQGVAVAARLDARRVSVLLLDDRDPAVRMLAAERLTLSAALWRAGEARRAADDAAAARDRLGRVTQALATYDGPAAELALCRHVARVWGAQRCALGVVRPAGVRVRAASDAAEPPQGRLRIALADAMQECADQAREVAWPEPGDAVAREAAALARHAAAGAVVSLPVLDGDRARAVLTIEWADQPEDVDGLRVLTQLLRPAVLARCAAGRVLSPRLSAAARRAAAAVVGPRHTAAKLAAGAFAAAAVAACVVPGDVAASGTFLAESDERRVVAAPYAGVLRSVDVEAGDAVAVGAALGALDAADRQLELSAVRAQAQAERAKAQAARAGGDPASAELADLEAAALAARAALLTSQLDAAALVAPAGGVVLRAPAADRIDTPVERGEPLLTIGPAATGRAVVLIDERDAGDLAAGQAVALRPAATPGTVIDGTITSIGPAVEDAGGRRVVRAIIAADRPLRHGGEGAAHVTTGRAPLAAVWLRPVWRAARNLTGF